MSIISDIFKKDLAGLYFSSKGVVILEQVSGKIKSQLSLPYPFSGEEMANIVSDDIFDVFKNKDEELMAFLQKAIRDSKIDTSNIVVALPPKDLIVRFFEMPNIPKAEVLAGINFEMKKYIPFKIEELAYDFQYSVKQKSNIIEVVLCGIKQDPLDRYVNLFKRLNLEPVAFEPGLFSLFRLLVIKNKISSKKSYVILEFDKKEANILIIEKGFPYFTRDIKLVLSSSTAKPQEEFDAILFRLINEVRVSLDYYKRQFLKKDVDEMLMIASEDYSGWADNFTKELGLKVEFISLAGLLAIKDLRNDMLSDAGKAFGAALRIEKPSLITLNLWKAKERTEKAAALAISGVSGVNLQEMILGFLAESKKAIIKGLLISGVIIAVGYGLGASKVMVSKNELDAASLKQPPMLPGMDLSNLDSAKASEMILIEKSKDFTTAINKKFIFYKKLIILAKLLPGGVWISSLNFSSDPPMLQMSCYSYSEDQRSISENINKFIVNLKSADEFSKDFNSIELKSYREAIRDGVNYMQFDITCEKKA